MLLRSLWSNSVDWKILFVFVALNPHFLWELHQGRDQCRRVTVSVFSVSELPLCLLMPHHPLKVLSFINSCTLFTHLEQWVPSQTRPHSLTPLYPHKLSILHYQNSYKVTQCIMSAQSTPIASKLYLPYTFLLPSPSHSAKSHAPFKQLISIMHILDWYAWFYVQVCSTFVRVQVSPLHS